MGFMKFFVFAICIVGMQGAKINSLEIFAKERDNSLCAIDFTGLIPHPMYCQFCYLCDDGVAYLRECPSGLYFNPRLESCDLPQNVPECVGGTRPPTGSTTPVPTTTTTTTTPGPETEGTVNTAPATTTTPPPGELTCPEDRSVFMSYPGDCSRYYFCANGAVVSVHSCDSGLWFRYSIQSCQTPWGGNCN